MAALELSSFKLWKRRAKKYFTSVVNFIKDLQGAFMRTDPKSAKKAVKTSVSFYAFGT